MTEDDVAETGDGRLAATAPHGIKPVPLFTAAPQNLFVSHRCDGAPQIFVKAEPTRTYGVSLLRIRFPAAHLHNPGWDQHAFWMQHSTPLTSTLTFAGRRREHDKMRRSVTVFPASIDMAVETATPSEGTLLQVSVECLALAAAQLTPKGGRLLDRVNWYDDALFRIVQTLEREAAAGNPNGMLFWSSAADALIRHLSEHHLSAPCASPRGKLSDRALRRLDDYIHAHLAASLDLHRLAAVIGCDRFHFAHRFRATVGMSPHRYVMRLRLDRARARIRAGAGSLADIACEAGFADQSHLCRWIRRVHNLRPNDLRGWSGTSSDLREPRAGGAHPHPSPSSPALTPRIDPAPR